MISAFLGFMEILFSIFSGRNLFSKLIYILRCLNSLSYIKLLRTGSTVWIGAPVDPPAEH